MSTVRVRRRSRRAHVGRDARVSVKIMRELFNRSSYPFPRTGGRKRHIFQANRMDDVLVLADALQEYGYVSLGQNMIKKVNDFRNPSRSGPAGEALARSWGFLATRVRKALDEIENRDRPSLLRARAGLKRKTIEDPALRQSYDYFRSQGAHPAQAMDMARAEQFFFRHDYELEVMSESERYQDVYGYDRENAKIERKYNFVFLEIIDSRGNRRSGLSMVEDSPDSIRWHRAELMLESMPGSRLRQAAREDSRNVVPPKPLH